MRMTWPLLIVLSLPFFLPGRVSADVSAEDDVLPPVAIVFTGQYDRIERGLELLSEGRVKQLFITGVNPKAGLRLERFADQFSLTSEQRDWLAQGRIILAPNARSTIENAIETACWLGSQPEVRSVTLITSQRHMARAALALERAINPVHVVRVASDTADADQLNDPGEAREFAATWAITLLPRDLWPTDNLADCQPR